MSDIERQLRDYGEFHDEEWGPIRPEDILTSRVGHGSVQLVQPRQPQYRPHRRSLIALATAAAVLVLLGSVALLFQTSESGTTVAGNEVPTTLSESALTTVAESNPISASGCLAPATWTRVCDDAAGFEGVVILSVTAGGPGLVAVGRTDVYEVDGGAAVWTSSDGLTWSRVPHDEAVFGGHGDPGMSSVTAGGPGLVAVGAANGDAAVWTSSDGLTWSRVPHDEAVFGGHGDPGMSSVTVGGPGLVAVGAANGDAAVWTSSDGFTWSRVPHDEAVFGGISDQEMSSVTAGGPGLVAVGSDGREAGVLSSCCITRAGVLSDVDADAVAAVWTSPDGFTWSRVPHDRAVFGGDVVQAMMSVTVGGPGLVAVGATSGIDTGQGADGAVWTSVNGYTWSRVPHDPAVFGGSTGGLSQDWMASVTAGGPGLVAVGSSGMVQGDIEEAIWTSPDGITWTRLPRSNHACSAEMWGVTGGTFGLVAVGFEYHDCGAATESTAAIWHD